MIELSDLILSLERTLKQTQHGCGNHRCKIKPPKGQGTNSVCQCDPTYFAKYFQLLADECKENGHEWPKPVRGLIMGTGAAEGHCYHE